MQKARAGASAPDFAASANEHRCFGGKACAQELSCQGWYRSQSAVNCAQALQQTDVTLPTLTHVLGLSLHDPLRRSLPPPFRVLQ